MTQPANVSMPSAPLSLLAPVDGVLVALEEVPDPVFSGRLMGDGVAIDPTGTLLSAPCAGTVVQLHRAKHALTLRTDSGVSVLLHIGLDTVTLAGSGFTPQVKEGDRVAAGQALIEFDLDAIAQNALSALTLMIVTEGAQHFTFKRASGLVKGSADEVLRFGAESHEPTAPSGTGELVQSEALFIVNPNGLHARPAAQLVTWAKRFQSRITLHKGQASAAATSVTEIMALDLARGDQISLSARGHDAKEALAALKSVIASGLGEDLGKAPPVSSTRKFVSSSADVLGGVAAAPGVAIGRTKVRAFEVPQFETRSTRPVEVVATTSTIVGSER